VGIVQWVENDRNEIQDLSRVVASHIAVDIVGHFILSRSKIGGC
jgi:hypothetical protein